MLVARQRRLPEGQSREERRAITPGTPSLPQRRSRLGVHILGWLFAWLLRLQWATWRREVEGLERLDRRLARGERTLVAFWHGKYLPLFTLLRGRSACVFTSQSLRGEVIAEICQRFGYGCVLLPDSASIRSFMLLRQALSTSQTGAIAVDGPLGPHHVVKHGTILLASELGFVLLPVSVAARRTWVLKQRWDRREIPWLFTRVCLVIGEPLEVPAGLRRDAIEVWARGLRDALETVDQQAEEKAKDTGTGLRCA